MLQFLYYLIANKLLSFTLVATCWYNCRVDKGSIAQENKIYLLDIAIANVPQNLNSAGQGQLTGY